MPQFNLYPLVDSFIGEDVFIFYRTSTGSVKNISGDDLVASIKALMSKRLSIRTLSSTATLGSTDEFVVLNSASTFTVNLPATIDNPGAPYYISNKGAGTVTLAANGTDTIFGQGTLAVPQYTGFVLIPDGMGMWHKF